MKIGKVYFDGWAGRVGVPCEILEELAGKYKVRLLEEAYGRPKGKILHPPKHAVTVEDIQTR